MHEKDIVFIRKEDGSVVAKNDQCSKELQSSFLTETARRYWDSWIKHNGQKRLVSQDFKVSMETIGCHLSQAAVAHGYRNLNDAKHQLGFANRRSPTKYAGGCIDAVALKHLLEMQGYKCALTGVKLTPKTAELDHKTPLSEGGTNDLDNLQWVERSVNRAKGTLTNEEFIEVCKRVSSYQKK